MRNQTVSGRTALYATAAAIAFAMFIVGTSAIADDSSSASSSGPANVTQADVSGQVNGEKKKANQKNSEADKLITNNEMRAMSGATSKWSMSNAIGYQGGTIASPVGQDRPDITGGSGNTVKSYLSDVASVKYNLNATNSILAGVGMRWIAPTSPTGPSNYPGTTFDVNNPQLTYQNIANLRGVQSIFQASVLQWTEADQTAIGAAQQYSLTETAEYAFGKLSLGATFYTQYQTFNKSGTFMNTSTNKLESLLTQQSQDLFAIYPLLEYQFNDKWNFRTLAGLAAEHYRDQSNINTYQADIWYQSIGVGYAMTRDIFLYPNVQFLPQHVAMNLTNVGLSAYINVF